MQYSIRSWIAVTTLFAVSCAAIIAYQKLPTPIDRVYGILHSEMSEGQKLKALAPYLSLGDKEDDINDRLRSKPEGHRCGFTHDLWSFKCGLDLTYLNGTLVSIGYDIGDGTGFHELASESFEAK